MRLVRLILLSAELLLSTHLGVRSTTIVFESLGIVGEVKSIHSELTLPDEQSRSV